MSESESEDVNASVDVCEDVYVEQEDKLHSMEQLLLLQQLSVQLTNLVRCSSE